ncbi:MAG: organic solvent tolerance protein OstA [Spirochaetaceae bacterium]|nr:organic solvent tolerance protein OstA [Spirochaetaceae bacterium]
MLLSLFAATAFCEKISFTADYMHGSASETNNKTVLERHAHISTDTFDINASVIELEAENYRYVTATGSVSGKSKKSNLDFTCDKLFFDRETDLVYFECNVYVKDESNNVDAHSQLMEYDLNTETAVLQVNVKLNQNNSKGTSSLAVYKTKEKTVDLTGNPKIVRGSDIFKAQKITLNVETEEILLDGKVSGNVTSEDN